MPMVLIDKAGGRRVTGPAPTPEGLFRCTTTLSVRTAACSVSRRSGVTPSIPCAMGARAMATDRLCEVDGCDRPFLARGMCEVHYRRARRGTDPDHERPCVVCGGSLAGRRSDARYCSTLCSSRGPTARAYRAANRAALNERARLWQIENAERAAAHTRAWARRNGTERRHRRRVRILGGEYEAVSAAAWAAKLAAYEGRCAYCGDLATEVDHVVPLARGGGHMLDNLVPACQPCNRSKSDKLLSEWKGVMR